MFILRRDIIAYACIAAFAFAGGTAIHLNTVSGLDAARARYRAESHAASMAAATDAQAQFDSIYQNLRTISRLPSVKKTDRYATNINQDGIDTIQELYNNLASNVDVLFNAARGSMRHIKLILATLFGLFMMSVQAPAWSQTSFDPKPLETAAASGDATAAFKLGTLDYVGLGVIQDYIGALRLLKQSAGAGNMEAACEVGFLYQTGSFAQGPPPPDPKDAAPWYQKAATAGNPCGEFGLAALYQSGQGVTKNPTLAATLFAQAASLGLAADPTSFPLQQLQERFYAVAYQLTGQTHWVDLVSRAAGGGQ